jgi:hypothetical protein
LALIAAFLACFYDWSPYLTGGERGTIMVVAADRKQARSIFRYLKKMLSIPLLFVREARVDLEGRGAFAEPGSPISWPMPSRHR